MAVTTVQTYALSGHIIEDTGNLVRVGPESAAQFLRVRDATVTYQVTTGGPTYTDTVPGLQAAVAYGSSPAVTTVDARLARYVTFIVPAYGGVAPLQVAPEAAYNFYAQQGYVIPLDICYLHHWNYYQNTGGVVLPPPGGSMSGGGTMGAFSSHAIQGGGVVTTPVAFVLCGVEDNAHGGYHTEPSSQAGVWFKVDALPASATTLLDLTQDNSNYIRVTLNSDGSVHLSTSLHGGAVSDAPVTAVGTPVAPRRWHFVGLCSQRNAAADNAEWQEAAVWTEGGVYLGTGTHDTGVPYDYRTLNALLGVGVTGAGGSAANFPNLAGWELSHPFITYHGNPWPNPTIPGPTFGDFGIGDGLYFNMSETAGAQPTLADTTNTPAHALTAGPQGMAVTADGPFGRVGVPYTSGTTSVNLFLKIGAAPGAETVLVDLDGAGAGWVRLSLTPAGTLHVAYQYDGAAAVDLYAKTLDNSAILALQTNVWYFLSVGAYHVTLYQGAQKVSDTTVVGGGSLNATVVVGWGAPVRAAAAGAVLSAFPNDTVHKMSKLYIADTGGTIAPLTTDVAAGSVAYMCRDGLGVETILIDASGQNKPLAAAAQGLTINAEGPFA